MTALEDTEPYSNIALYLIGASPDGIGFIFGILIILILFIISALVSGSEVAYFSLSPTEIDKIHSEKGRTPRQIITLLENPEKLLATILITNNFVNVGIVILSSFLNSDIFHF